LKRDRLCHKGQGGAQSSAVKDMFGEKIEVQGISMPESDRDGRSPVQHHAQLAKWG
jgi:hypothetical protein